MNHLVLIGGLIGLAAVAGVPAATWLGGASPEQPAAADKALPTAPVVPALLSEDGARQIAWRSGLDHIEEIVLSGKRWELAGRDRTGQEMTLDIDAGDGRLLH